MTISGSSKVENIGANTIFVDSTQAGAGKNNSIQISGGSFNFPISPEYCAPGFEIQQNADGSVVVVPDGSTTPPAQNNGQLRFDHFFNRSKYGGSRATGPTE